MYALPSMMKRSKRVTVPVRPLTDLDTPRGGAVGPVDHAVVRGEDDGNELRAHRAT